jgi:hypothetical protein
MTVMKPESAYAEVYEYTAYKQDGNSEPIFRVDIPKDFFKSKRPLTNGTIFVAGSLKTVCHSAHSQLHGVLCLTMNPPQAEIVSAQIVSVPQLLADIGVLPTGDFSTWESIGSAKAIADLLAANRDGDAKQRGGLASKVDPASVAVSGRSLSFLTVTSVAVQRPDKLLEAQGVSELRRITRARADLRRDGTLLVLWASALEQDWKAGAASSLGSVVDSLVVP